MISPVTVATTLYKIYSAAKDEWERELAVKTVANFLRSKGALQLAPRVYKEIERVARRAVGIVDAEVITAQKLSDRDMEAAKDKAAKILGKTGKGIEVSFRVDSNILGGMIVRTEEVLIDRSVGGRLKMLEQKLVS